MEKIDLINNLIKMILNFFLVYLVYVKITNYKENTIYKTIFAFLCSIDIALLYIIFNTYFQPLIVIIFSYLIYGVIITTIVIKEEMYSNFVSYVVSCVIAYLIYLTSMMISGILLWICVPNINSNNPVSLLMIPIIAITICNFIFRIKRFKNGFNFLNNVKIKNSIINYMVLFTGITVIIFGLLQGKNGILLNTGIFTGTILILISVIIWIKSQITKSYKSKMRDRTIEIQKTEIDEQTKIIEEIKAENLKLATSIHKYNHKFSALENAMKNALSLESKTEFADELSVILKEAEETSTNFAKETEVNTIKLSLTNIPGIDNMFKYMQEEANKNDINFDLKINESINPLIDNIISKDKFEILIGDHLKDAIIAVNASKAQYKSILTTLGLVQDIYEFSVYDTGIEFEIETLLKLGTEQVTTHKETGGSGIGFMTTFETLKECKASLVIEEYNPETTSYTKSVTIRFDGKNEYKICSYRAEKIKEQKHKRRIIIEKLK